MRQNDRAGYDDGHLHHNRRPAAPGQAGRLAALDVVGLCMSESDSAANLAVEGDPPPIPNPGHFKPGQPKPPGSGRQKGTPNRFNADIQEALLEATNRYGYDGKGRDALVGFIMRLCDKEPGVVGGMLKCAMPRTVNAKVTHDAASVPYQEARERLISRGIDPALLEYLPHMSDEEAEARRAQAEAEAHAARAVKMNGGHEPEPVTIEGQVIEITE
jgi:hypothetical protein